MTDHTYKNEEDLGGYHLAECANIDHYPRIKGWDFDSPFDADAFLDSFFTTGFQASHLAQAARVVEMMRAKNATIFLGCTSNLITSGVRDIICYLVKHRMVHCLVTTAGGIEEDVIKVKKPFLLGRFDLPGEALRDKGICRTGNILIPNDRYLHFERFMNPFLERMHAMQLAKKRPLCTSELIRELGLTLGDEEKREESILYWAAKNDIPVFCPALGDGSLGDLLVFFKHRRPDFALDIAEDNVRMSRFVLAQETAGAIILGGGVAKHYILNNNIFKDGLDFAVYINTASETDGSDSGAAVSEAVSWNKIRPTAPHVKVVCDATIAFPILVAMTFGKVCKETGNNQL